MIDAPAELAWAAGACLCACLCAAQLGCVEPEQTTARLQLDAPLATSDAIVARVGNLAISAGMVASSARLRGVTPRAATESLVNDAVAARVALDRGLDTRDDVRRSLDAALARQVVRRVREASVARGPLTDQEVAKLTELHWKEVALPERVRVIHAVVRTGTDAKRGEALAAKLHAALETTASPEEFEGIAQAFPKDGFEIKVERLQPFGADGRLTDRGIDGSMDPTFAAAAIKLAPGATSDVVATPFGWHVIRAIEKMPAETVPLERRREMFFDEGVAARAREGHEAVIAAQRAKREVKVEPFAEAALATIQLGAEVVPPASTAPVASTSSAAGRPQ